MKFMTDPGYFHGFTKVFVYSLTELMHIARLLEAGGGLEGLGTRGVSAVTQGDRLSSASE